MVGCRGGFTAGGADARGAIGRAAMRSVLDAIDETDTFLYAGGLIALGIVLWLINRWATSRASRPG